MHIIIFSSTLPSDATLNFIYLNEFGAQLFPNKSNDSSFIIDPLKSLVIGAHTNKSKEFEVKALYPGHLLLGLNQTEKSKIVFEK